MVVEGKAGKTHGNSITVVGVGPAKGFLTQRAMEIISRAEVVFGSRRALELAREHIRGDKVELTRFDEEEMARILETGAKKEVVVLSTGDPMVSGLGKLIKGRIEPGISSIQLALARLGVDLCEAVVVDAHGRENYSEILRALEFRNRVLVLIDRKFDPVTLIGLVERELAGKLRRLAILTNLGMEDERVIEFEAGDSTEMIAQLVIESDLAIVYAETSEPADSINGKMD